MKSATEAKGLIDCGDAARRRRTPHEQAHRLRRRRGPCGATGRRLGSQAAAAEMAERKAAGSAKQHARRMREIAKQRRELEQRSERAAKLRRRRPCSSSPTSERALQGKGRRRRRASDEGTQRHQGEPGAQTIVIHVLSSTRLVQSELAVSLPSAIHRKEVGGEFAEPPLLHPGRGEHVFLCRREDRLVEHDPVGRRAEKHRVGVERKARARAGLRGSHRHQPRIASRPRLRSIRGLRHDRWHWWRWCHRARAWRRRWVARRASRAGARAVRAPAQREAAHARAAAGGDTKRRTWPFRDAACAPMHRGH